jgi:hypothetical protein
VFASFTNIRGAGSGSSRLSIPPVLSDLPVTDGDDEICLPWPDLVTLATIRATITGLPLRIGAVDPRSSGVSRRALPAMSTPLDFWSGVGGFRSCRVFGSQRRHSGGRGRMGSRIGPEYLWDEVHQQLTIRSRRMVQTAPACSESRIQARGRIPIVAIKSANDAPSHPFCKTHAWHGRAPGLD